jgi:2,3-bisphosphoglycerate-independent phosphoglycerate mutase
MKYVIVLPDGAADHPVAELGHRTPLHAAQIPHMDWIAQNGRLGRVVTVPAGFVPGTDVATLALFGYDPARYYSGRAPIEAAAQGLRTKPDEIIFRCNFVTVIDSRMRDFTAGHITQVEANALIASLNAAAQQGDPAFAGCTFYSGVSYRNLMIAPGAAEYELTCTPPHDIPNELVAPHLPHGRGQDRVRTMMERAAELVRDHPVNQARRTQNRPPVTGIWLWGQGQPTRLEPLAERFGLRGAVITAVDIIRGLGMSMGLTPLHVPGATGYLDTDYVAKGRATVEALSKYDLVVVHIEAPDEAAHEGKATEKVRALERIDEHIVGPALNALRALPEWRILVAPDHVTAVASTAHEAGPPPFCFAGSGVPAVERRAFSELEAEAGGWLVDPGHQLLRLFLSS